MSLHPGDKPDNLSDEGPAVWDPIRRALQENEDWHRDIAQNSHNLLCIHDLEGRFLSVNPSPARLLGYSVEEILRKRAQEVIDPQYRAEFAEYVREVEQNGEARGRMAVVTRSGEQRIWEYYSTLRTEGVASPIVRVIAQDVTERVRAERALRATNEQLLKTTHQQEELLRGLNLFRALLDQSNDAIQVIEPETLRFLDVNERTCLELGYSREDLLGMTVYDIAPEFDARARAEVLRQLDVAGTAIIERVHRRRDGTTFPVEVNLRRVRLDREYGVAIARDITARKRAEEVLRAKNDELVESARERERTMQELRLFRALLDQSNDAVEVIDPESMRLLDVNHRECVQLGYSREELLTMTIYDIDPNVDKSMQDGVLQKLRETGFLIMETLHRRKDGTTFPVEVNVRRVQLEREYLLAVARDITVRKQAEERQREYERVVEGVEEMILVVDRDYHIVIANSAYLQYRSLSEEQAVGHSLWEIVGNSFFEAVIKPKLDECLTGKVVRYEKRETYPELGMRDVSVSYFPIEAAGGIDRVAVILKDITQQKLREEALRESEARERARAKELETVLDAVPLAVCIAYDAECRRMSGNRAAHEQLRVPADKNLSKSAPLEERPEFRMLQDGVEIPADQLPMQQAAATGASIHRRVTLRFGDGTERETLSTAIPLLDEQGKARGAVGVSVDITDQQRAEKALRESEVLFRTVYERSPAGIAVLDGITGRFLQANAKFCEIVGRDEPELKRTEVAEITHPEDVAQGNQYRQQMLEGALDSYEQEKRYVRLDGSTRWARILVVRMGSDGEKRNWHMALVQDITESRKTESAITNLVQQVRADSSENFFSSMAIQLGKCLEADYTIIGELVPGEENKVITLGVCGQGAIADNFTRELPDTPCGVVVEQGSGCYLSGVTEAFPKDSLLKQMKVEAYVGIALRDSQGRTIGLMVALYLAPLKNASFAEMILRLFSTRTAAEIERKRTEEALRMSEERFRVALKNSPIAVFSQDRDLRYTWGYNPKFPGAVAYAVGRTTGEVFDPQEGTRVTEMRRRVLETGVGVRDEVRLTVGGKKLYLDTTIEPLIDAQGKVIGLTGASMDITELREATEALREAKKKLTEEKLYLEQEIDTQLGFGEIIGQSKALLSVMEHVGKVAASDATVLLLGETGTGKELVARAIHRLSHRAETSFIKMNCAAIPSGLLESELFGNERGAFTGAISKKIGRLELADKGTLFLDEIGEIPLALQPKLLRVLQDQEFERLGGTQTIKVDFRLIAATNRDLADSVREQEFRSDLYYRLNVFPIRVPPLRERRDDIRLLVEYFVQKYARRMHKSIISVPRKTLDGLMQWDWPGNVRELENFIERSVILTQGSVLVAPLSELAPNVTAAKGMDETLVATEREHILRALRQSHGQIGGPKGAAKRLGLKRTTLQSKLKQLGINPHALDE